MFASLGLLCPVFAEQTAVPTDESASKENEEKNIESYGVTVPAAVEQASFGGPTSVGGQLQKDAEVTNATIEKDDPLKPYYAFKSKLEKSGFRYGADYNLLYQHANASLGEKNAAGGVLRFYGTWRLPDNNEKTTGKLVYKVEHRHRLVTDTVPQDLGVEIGYAGLTAVPFSDIGWALTNFFWEQPLLDNRLSFVVGVVDTTDYVATYNMLNPWTDFSNLAFSTDPAIPAPNQGLGAALRVLATDNIYMVMGVADTNGDPTKLGDSFDSFFNTAEVFTHFEVGWVASQAQQFSKNIHLTAWHADAREQAALPSGWGLAFSYNWLFDDKWEPFLRVGYSDEGGALWENSVSVGVGYHVNEENDALALGFNWSRPSETLFGTGLDNQYTAEFFYRFQISSVMSLTPDVQLLVNPALNPQQDHIWILGVRARLTF